MRMAYIFRNLVLLVHKSILYFSYQDKRCSYTQYTTWGQICRDSVEIIAIFDQSSSEAKEQNIDFLRS